ncbi:hypothetical protein ACIQBJ_32215 [Kitasatospora sp. NPDC088391]|uniref:hypothetical protein n=1 Tax=Kitasatospora sp. NPDC088391 TaxID=3364074 RepID=UPI003805601B
MNEAMNDAGDGAVAGAAAGAVGGAIGGAVAAMVAQTAALVGAVGAGAVKVEVENLQTFKARVDDILRDLDGSAASQGKISQQQLTAGQLGQNFGQAGDLMSAYSTVHANLEQLSRTLSLQIEAMSASIDMAARGYQNADAEQQQKFHSILNQAGAQSQLPPAGGQPGAQQVGTQQIGRQAPPAGPVGTQQGSY